MTPHPYQSEYLYDIEEGWKQFSKQLVISPTGSGKTVMFSWLTKWWVDAGKRVLILVDQDELVWQTINKLKSVADLIGEPEKAEWRANKDAKVVVATVQSMARRLEHWPADAFGLVIADEADKSIAAQWQKVLNHFDKTAKVAGFTATPNRSDRRNLGEYYENAIERENLFSLIHKGFLSPICIQMLPIQIDLSAATTRGGDYDENELDEIITPHLVEIAKAIQHYASFRRTLVFLPLIKTCEKFNTIARDIGLNSEFIYGDDPDRDSKLTRFKRWDFDVLANSMLLTRGVDIPEVDCIVPCRPTKSVTLYFQMVGRGTRMASGKTECLLLDFLYQASKKLVCRPAHLIAKTEEEAKQITELAQERFAALPADIAAQMPLDLQLLAGDAVAQREEALRKKLEAQKDKKAKTVSAEEFAMQHNSLDTAEYQPAMPWEGAPISERQAKYLKRAHIDVTTVKGKGHASKLLSLFFASKTLTLASQGQRNKMRQMGYAGWEHATASEAGKFFAALNKPKESQLI